MDSKIQVTPLVPLKLKSQQGSSLDQNSDGDDDFDVKIIEVTNKDTVNEIISLSSSEDEADGVNATVNSIVKKSPKTPVNTGKQTPDKIPHQALYHVPPKVSPSLSVVLMNCTSMIPKELNPNLNIAGDNTPENHGNHSQNNGTSARPIAFIDMSTAVPIKTTPIVISDGESNDAVHDIALKTTIGLRPLKPRNTARKSTSNFRYNRNSISPSKVTVQGTLERPPPSTSSQVKVKNTARKSTSGLKSKLHNNLKSPFQKESNAVIQMSYSSSVVGKKEGKLDVAQKIQPIKNEEPDKDKKSLNGFMLPLDHYGESAMEDPMIKAYYETLRLNQERRDQEALVEKMEQEDFNRKSEAFEKNGCQNDENSENIDNKALISDVSKSVGNLTAEEMDSLLSMDFDTSIFQKLSNTKSEDTTKVIAKKKLGRPKKIKKAFVNRKNNSVKMRKDNLLDEKFQLKSESSGFDKTQNYIDNNAVFNYLLENIPEKVIKKQEKNDPDYNPTEKKIFIKERIKYNSSDSRESDLSSENNDTTPILSSSSQTKIGTKRKVVQVAGEKRTTGRPVGRPRKNIVNSFKKRELYSSEDELPLTAITAEIDTVNSQVSEDDVPLKSLKNVIKRSKKKSIINRECCIRH